MSRIRLRTSARALRAPEHQLPEPKNVATFVRPMTIAIVDGCIALTLQDIDGKTYTDSLTRAQSLAFASQIINWARIK